MPDLIIQQFAKSSSNDFAIFQWTWGNQTNVTIHAKSVKNPIGLKSEVKWPSFNGNPLPPERLASMINDTSARGVKIDNIEIILCNGGGSSNGRPGYVEQTSSLIDGSINVIGYTHNSVDTLPQKLQDAFAGLPYDAIVDRATLDSLTHMPGFGSLDSLRALRISRFDKSGRLMVGSGSPFHPSQPYHVRAGSGPQRSLPLGASGASHHGGRVRNLTTEAEDAAEEFIEVVGL